MKKIILIFAMLLASVSLFAYGDYITRNNEGEVRIYGINHHSYIIYDETFTVLESGVKYSVNLMTGEFRFKNNETNESYHVIFKDNRDSTLATLTLDTGEELELFGKDYDIYTHDDFWLGGFENYPLTREEFEEFVEEEPVFDILETARTKAPKSIIGTFTVEGQEIVVTFNTTDKATYTIVSRETGELIEEGEWMMSMGLFEFGGEDYSVEWIDNWTAKLNVRDSEQYFILNKLGVEERTYNYK